MSAPFEARLSGAVLRLRRRSPFFAVLADHARHLPAEAAHGRPVPTAATDGRDVYYNPVFMAGLSRERFDAVVAHEVLHAALDHVNRRGAREPARWNLACDVVVNGVLAAEGFEVDWLVRRPALEDRSAEEVYALLEPEGAAPAPDLIEPAGGPPLEVTARWRGALARAAAVARAAHRGALPAGLARLLGEAEPRLDWRALLWRFLARTPVDYDDFDEREVWRGVYMEALEAESVRVAACVDTSGSVDDAEVAAFLGEVRGVVGAYPHVACALYYADAELHGPHELERAGALPPPRGGGGTDFRPFFEALAASAPQPDLAVYLTDGLGSFPDRAPGVPTLWVLVPGGLAPEELPFGEHALLL